MAKVGTHRKYKKALHSPIHQMCPSVVYDGPWRKVRDQTVEVGIGQNTAVAFENFLFIIVLLLDKRA